MKILNYGSINVDHVYQIPHIVLPGETIHSSSVATYAGGKGANQSIALAKAGADVWHAGTIGADGAWVQQLLQTNGVHTDYIKRWDGPTGHTVIQVDQSGQNSIILFGGGNIQQLPEEIEATLANFSKGDWLVLQNEINLTEQIIDAAYEKGLHICLNPSPYTDTIASWSLEKLKLLIVNEIEAMSIAEYVGSYEDTLQILTSRYPALHILMTVGEDGAYYGKDTERVFVPIVEAPVVDTTAAGDTFLGFFLAEFIAGNSIESAMRIASKASSITVSRPGAMNSIPVREELL